MPYDIPRERVDELIDVIGQAFSRSPDPLSDYVFELEPNALYFKERLLRSIGEACPPSATYRLRKYARRYKTHVAVATAFVILLMLSTVVAWGLLVAPFDWDLGRWDEERDPVPVEEMFAK